MICDQRAAPRREDKVNRMSWIAVPWWRNRLLLAALCLATCPPVLVTSLPPLTDYLGHIGRYRIQTGLADSPLLGRSWDFH